MNDPKNLLENKIKVIVDVYQIKINNLRKQKQAIKYSIETLEEVIYDLKDMLDLNELEKLESELDEFKTK